VQTFVPYPSFTESAKILDYRRLGKQRVEVLQILNSLVLNRQYGWRYHPATKMWAGHERGLAAYGLSICSEWVQRGYKDTCTQKISDLVTPDWEDMPSWWGDERIHSSHRANLLRKDPIYYGQYNWTEDPEMPYFWPTTDLTVITLSDNLIF